MSSTITQPAERPWVVEGSGSWRDARSVLDRFRNTQLREGSAYDSIRSMLPVLGLALLWAHAVAWYPASHVEPLLERSETVRHVLTALSVVFLWNASLGLSPYDRRWLKADIWAEVRRLSIAALLCGGLLLGWELTRRPLQHGLPIAIAGTICLMTIAFASMACFVGAAAVSLRLEPKRAAILVGTGERAELVKANLATQYATVEVYGCVDDEDRSALARSPYLGTIEQLPAILKTHPIELVLIGLPMRSKYDEIQRVIEICETVGVESHYMRDIFTTSRSRVQAHAQVPHDFSVISSFIPHPKQHVKRLFDIVGALILLLLASPLLLATAIAIRCTSQGPVLFIQQRYGRNRKRFPMFKFRSMVVDAEKRQAALEAMNEAQGPVFKLAHDPRVTRVGSFIRKTSIDELPQLFNVLRGEMSLVGPRPLPHRDVAKFEEPWLLRRFSVRPGLTCIWQVNGRSNTSFSDWIKQDLEYIDGWSLSMDVRILAQTIPAVLRARGAV